MVFYPDWLGFWRHDEKALLQKYQSWEEIAMDLNYARRWTLEKHREALDAVQRILDEREEEQEN